METASDQVVQQAETPLPVVTQKISRQRNYSFKHRNVDTLDIAKFGGDDNPDAKAPTFHIPAHIGSIYWAILKVCYENANQPVYLDKLVIAVQDLMKDRDAQAWENYTNKESATVHRRSSGKSATQKIKPWQERVVNNAKTLTRQGGDSAYGKRLSERGHALRLKTDSNMKQYFILITNPADM